MPVVSYPDNLPPCPISAEFDDPVCCVNIDELRGLKCKRYEQHAALVMDLEASSFIVGRSYKFS